MAGLGGGVCRPGAGDGGDDARRLAGEVELARAAGIPNTNGNRRAAGVIAFPLPPSNLRPGFPPVPAQYQVADTVVTLEAPKDRSSQSADLIFRPHLLPMFTIGLLFLPIRLQVSIFLNLAFKNPNHRIPLRNLYRRWIFK